MIALSWVPFPEANVANYRVYRSIIGFVATNALPASLAGLTLQLKLNGGNTQTIMFNGTDTPKTAINAVIQDGQAYDYAADATKFIFRSSVREAPGSVQIVGGTALAALGLTARTISQISEDLLLATIPALVDPTQTVTFDDDDGSLQDYYAVTTLDSFANESLKTSYRQPISTTGAVCVLEGFVVDLQGARVADAEVRATIANYPEGSGSGVQVARTPICTLSDADGRFSLTLLQGYLVRLEIPLVGFGRNITVPAQPYVFITDLAADQDYQFTPDGVI